MSTDRDLLALVHNFLRSKSTWLFGFAAALEYHRPNSAKFIRGQATQMLDELLASENLMREMDSGDREFDDALSALRRRKP